MWIISPGGNKVPFQPKMVNLESFDFIAVQEGYALDRSGWYVVARHIMPSGTAELPLITCRSADEANGIVQRIGTAMKDGLELLDLTGGEAAERPVSRPRTVKDLAVL